MMNKKKKAATLLMVTTFTFSSFAAAPIPAAAAQPLPAVQVSGAVPGVLLPKSLTRGVHLEAQRRIAQSLFRAKFEGDRVAGTGEAVDGVYRINATVTDGESWHIKLESNYPTVTGHEYYVTYRFTSNVGGSVKFGDFQEFSISPGENTVTGLLIAKDGTSYLDLQLGMLAPFTIDFHEVEVVEMADSVSYKNIMPAPVDFEDDTMVYARFDQGYLPDFTRTSDSITANFFAKGYDPQVWKARLFVNTGAVPEPGKRYRVSADITCPEDMDFELLLNKGEQEKGYGALYSRHLTGGEVMTVEQLLAFPSRGFAGDEMVLQFALGKAPDDCDITVNNVHVDEVIEGYGSALPTRFALNERVATGNTYKVFVPTSLTKLDLPNFSFEGTDTISAQAADGYKVKMEEKSTMAILHITQSPSSLAAREEWKVKLNAATCVNLEAGSTYRVRYALECNHDIPAYNVCFSGSGNNKEYGALYGRSLAAGVPDEVEYLITPDASHGELTLNFELGETVTDTFEDNAIKISRLCVEKLENVSYEEVGTAPITVGGEGNVREEHSDSVAQTVSADGSSATLSVTTARSGGGIWSSKLFVNTGVTPEAGAKYRVSAKVAAVNSSSGAAQDIGDFEIIADNGSAEGGYGGLWGQKMAGGPVYSIDFTAPDADCSELKLRFQLGNTPAGTDITVSDVQVCKVTGESFTPLAAPDLSYPVYTPESTDKKSFDLEVNGSAAAKLTGDGSSATATVTTPGDDWHVKFYVKPGLELQAGETYTISMDVSGADGCPVSFKNTAVEGETGFGSGTVTGGKVTHTVTAAQTGTLEVLLKVGAVAADTAVTVSNVAITHSTTDFVPVTLTGFAYPTVTPESTDKKSFDLEANSGAAAKLTGDGSSATATVTTPGDDWNVKFYVKPVLELEAGQTYTISMDVANADGCQACFKNLATGAEDGFGTETISGGQVSHTVTPTENGTLEILLKLGTVPADTAVTVSNVAITKAVTDYYPASLGGFAYPVSTPPTTTHVDAAYVPQSVTLAGEATAWDGSEATASADGSSATLTVTKVRDSDKGGMWSTRLDANTGVTLKKGVKYKVSGTLISAKPGGFEVLYSNGAGTDEGAHNPGGQGYAEGSWGLNIAEAGGSVSFEKEFTVPERSEYRPLTLRIQAGNVSEPNTLTVSGVSVQEWVEAHDDTTPGTLAENSFELEANSGAAAVMTGDGSSATATVTTPGADWNVKFYAKTGMSLEAGQSYKIELDAANADGCQVCFKNADTGAEDGFGTETVSGGHVSHIVLPSQSGTLEVMLKLGNVAANTAVTVSNVKVSAYQTQEVSVLPESFAYATTTPAVEDKQSFELEANSGAAAVMTGDGSSATATVTTPGADWNVKFYAKTGLTLETGKTYKIDFDAANADGCQACFKNTATGAEDGFGTETVSGGKVSHTVTPTTSGTLEIMLKLGNVAANTAVTVSNVQISEYKPTEADVLPEGFGYTETTPAGLTPNAFAVEGNAELTGDGSSATATITTSPHEDWRVKFYAKPGVQLEAGKTYQIDFDVTGADGCQACFKRVDGEETDFGTETVSGGHVTHTVTAAQTGTLEILLKLGTLDDGAAVTVSNIQLQVSEASLGENLMTDPLTASSSGSVTFWAHEAYAAALSGDGSTASLAITGSPADGRESWKVKLFAETGIALKAGETYRVSADVSADAAADYEICYNNGGAEAALGKQDGLHTSTAAQTVSYVVEPKDAADLVLQLNLGLAKAPCTVTLGNVKVEKMTYTPTNLTEDFRYNSTGSFDNAADGGYIVSLDKQKSSVTYNILQAPATDRHPWNAKLFLHTGITPKKDKGYRVTFDVTSQRPQSAFEVFYDGNSEELYGRLDNQSLPAGKKTISYTTMPGVSDGELVAQLRFGQTDGPEGNSYTISNVKVEEAEGFVEERAEIVGAAELWTHETYAAELSKTPSSATVDFISVPSFGREAWKTKLFIDTGMNLTPGQKYRISMEVYSNSGIPYEICFNRGNVEKAVGAMYGLTALPQPQIVDYTFYAADNAHLVIQFSLGRANAPSTFSVSNVKVEKAGPASRLSDTVYTF